MSEPITDTPTVVEPNNPNPPATEPTNPADKTSVDNPPTETKKDEPTTATFAKMRKDLSETQKALKAYQDAEKERDFAKMSKEQRAKAELDDERAQLDAERKAFLQEKQQGQIADDLAEKGLPKSFAKVLALLDDDEEVLTLIAEAVKEQSELIDSKTKTLLSGNPPKVSRNTGDAPVTKEAFSKMTYAQKMELYQTDKELYKQLQEG